jgi:hypothetical protein
MKVNRRAYGFEALEGRALLSTVHLPHPKVVEVARTKAPSARVFSGTIIGTYQLDYSGVYATAPEVTFNGSGPIAGLGMATATGTIDGLIRADGGPFIGSITMFRSPFQGGSARKSGVAGLGLTLAGAAPKDNRIPTPFGASVAEVTFGTGKFDPGLFHRLGRGNGAIALGPPTGAGTTGPFSLTLVVRLR